MTEHSQTYDERLQELVEALHKAWEVFKSVLSKALKKIVNGIRTFFKRYGYIIEQHIAKVFRARRLFYRKKKSQEKNWSKWKR